VCAARRPAGYFRAGVRGKAAALKSAALHSNLWGRPCRTDPFDFAQDERPPPPKEKCYIAPRHDTSLDVRMRWRRIEEGKGGVFV
jgi:hypothetical protein